MKKVLVTGGAGFIGSHTVVELIHAGYEPIVLDNFSNSNPKVMGQVERIIGRSIKVHEVDCADSEALRKVFREEGEIVGVLHFAAFKAVGESVEKPMLYYQNNLGSMTSVLEVMQEFGVAGLVFSSSCTVYGTPKENPVTENTPMQVASNPYGFTKQVCERMVEDLRKSGAPLKAVTLRYFNPIGAHPSSLIGELPIGKPNNLVPFITQTAAGMREKLVIFGGDYNTKDGTCVRDFIHVVDLAKAHVKALDYIQNRPGEQFNLIANIGTGNGATVLECVQIFEQVTGVKVNHEIGPRRPGDVEQIWAASSGDELGWKAELSLEDALRDAWNWQKTL